MEPCVTLNKNCISKLYRSLLSVVIYYQVT